MEKASLHDIWHKHHTALHVLITAYEHSLSLAVSSPVLFYALLFVHSSLLLTGHPHQSTKPRLQSLSGTHADSL